MSLSTLNNMSVIYSSHSLITYSLFRHLRTLGLPILRTNLRLVFLFFHLLLPSNSPPVHRTWLSQLCFIHKLTVPSSVAWGLKHICDSGSGGCPRRNGYSPRTVVLLHIHPLHKRSRSRGTFFLILSTWVYNRGLTYLIRASPFEHTCRRHRFWTPKFPCAPNRV